MDTAREKAAVLGAGSWGTALSVLLARRGFAVTLWAREEAVCRAVNETRRNELFLPQIELPAAVRATADMEECVADAVLVLIVIPAQFVRENVRRLRDALPVGAPLVLCSKGIERGSLMLLEAVLHDELPGKYHAGLSVLSGPSFALEVAQGLPTNVTVAARRADVAARVQRSLGGKMFRVYTSTDVVGVEVGGALKNVIAIAAGASDGLGFGHNTKAGLMTRGLAEMTRMTVALGGDPLTLSGLSGMGDLVLTCTGHLSRNRAVGEALARGVDPRDVLSGMVAEGVETSRSVYELARRIGCDMPICTEVYRTLHEGKPIQEALETLLERKPKAEVTFGE
jgi:glycerol-3-phosphate dehydrogenase